MLFRREITEEYWMTPSGLAADTMVVLAQGVRLSWGVTGGGMFSCSDIMREWYSDRHTYRQSGNIVHTLDIQYRNTPFLTAVHPFVLEQTAASSFSRTCPD